MQYTHRGVALVTGSSRGLGRMTALVLAEAGWDVAVHYRSGEQEARSLVDGLKKRGARSERFQGDVSRPLEARRVVQQVIESFGRLDVLVHAVGPFIRDRRRFSDLTIAEIEAMVDGNLKSALHTIHAALPAMRRQRVGRIVLFGFGRSGEAPSWPDRSAYAAAKTGLVSLTKSLAVEEAPSGITVNMVCPGDIVGDNKEKRIADVREERDEETPRGRPGSGEDVARVVRFLCEPDSDFVTGNIINVTGGLDVIHPVSKAER
ncbi:SDR family oxidoreductase [Salinithrix halophila]|uniref:SDR family oxidoreductase n=1 Tax=Salinithrix halophila TaxID=1485204 RepID=A0ABV8JH20_9BACL